MWHPEQYWDVITAIVHFRCQEAMDSVAWQVRWTKHQNCEEMSLSYKAANAVQKNMLDSHLPLVKLFAFNLRVEFKLPFICDSLLKFRAKSLHISDQIANIS